MIERILADFALFYKLLEPVSCENGRITIVPLGGKNSIKVLGIGTAEEKEIGWVQEMESESVSQLEVVNKGDIPILIPYLQTVKGGKQDRTVFEPILVPIGHDEKNPLVIPARCIERSRWSYSEQEAPEVEIRRFKASKNPRVAFSMGSVIQSVGEQTAVWDTIEEASSQFNLREEAAPTRSYLKMQEKVIEEREDLTELKKCLLKGVDHENQVGLAFFIGEEFVALEVYGSNTLWKEFSEEVLDGFLSETFFRGKKTKGSVSVQEAHEKILNEFLGLEVKEEKATGTGKLEKFRKGDGIWEGVSVSLSDVPAHLYAVKRGDIKLKKPTRLRTAQREVMQEIISMG